MAENQTVDYPKPPVNDFDIAKPPVKDFDIAKPPVKEPVFTDKKRIVEIPNPKTPPKP